MKLEIFYKNGQIDSFDEKQLDCTTWTLRGHASQLIQAFSKSSEGVYKIDSYNAVRLDEVASVRCV